MKYKIRNISYDKINILGRILNPQQEIIVFDLLPYKNMIDAGFLTIVQDPAQNGISLETDDIDGKSYKNNELNTNDETFKKDKLPLFNSNEREKIIESLFHFYIDRQMNDNDLANIKLFYKNIGLISLLDEYDKNLLESANNYEEFITILLNNIYPVLFERNKYY